MPAPSVRALCAVLASLLALAACEPRATGAPARPAYVPHARALTITTVPLLVREQAKVFPFLAADFAHGGVLDGKEVYAFEPNTLVAVEGDTLELTVVNPEDDVHMLNLPGLAVALPPQQVTHAAWIAARAGVYAFACNMPNHLPMMSGQVVVLAPAAIGAAEAPGR